MLRRLALLLSASAALAAAADGAMTSAERSFLLEQLEMSKKNMLASIEGLTDAQWKFKPAPNVWSVAECAEHIVLAEDYIFGASQQILKTPAVARPENSNSEADHKMVALLTDRSHKLTAPEPITPSAGGKFATPADAAREFTARRDKTIAYVKSTQDDLRVHVAPSPLGQIDDYQFLLLLAGHSSRHTLQIKEVQSNPGYPRASAAE
jgi:DinB superfamily